MNLVTIIIDITSGKVFVRCEVGTHWTLEYFFGFCEGNTIEQTGDVGLGVMFHA